MSNKEGRGREKNKEHGAQRKKQRGTIVAVLFSSTRGEVKESPRQFFFYISDDGDVLGIRMGDWKMVLAEQRATRMQCWAEPFVKLRLPKVFNLRRDPFERADENSNTYWDWVISHGYMLYGMQAVVAQQIDNFVK
jgi:arylsulfatase